MSCDHPPIVYPKGGCLLFRCGKCENIKCLLSGLRGDKRLNLDSLVKQVSCFRNFFFNVDIFIGLCVLEIYKGCFGDSSGDIA